MEEELQTKKFDYNMQKPATRGLRGYPPACM
jgi:hypothetical protein